MFRILLGKYVVCVAGIYILIGKFQCKELMLHIVKSYGTVVASSTFFFAPLIHVNYTDFFQNVQTCSLVAHTTSEREGKKRFNEVKIELSWEIEFSGFLPSPTFK